MGNAVGAGELSNPDQFDGIPVYGIIGIFVIFLLSLLGSLIPPLVGRYKPEFDMSKNFVFRFFAGFAAGVIIAVGFVHSFPEADEDLGETLEGFPFAGLFAMLGALSTFATEQLVKMAIPGFDHHGGHDHKDSEGELDRKQARDFYTEMWVLLCGLSFHSFFVGLALGLSYTDLALFLAIIFHQFFEGLALGFRIARVKIRRSLLIWLIDLVFAVTAPAGIITGIIIIEVAGSENEKVTIVKGSFNAFSAGILIFVGLVHMLTEEMEREEMEKKPLLRASMFSGLLLGASLMSLLAIWA